MGAIKRAKPKYIKFTTQKFKSLSSNKNWPIKETYYWNVGSDGFGVRVSPRGKISFVYRYKRKGKKRVFSIGKFPAVSLGKAGGIYAEKFKLVTEEGIDVCAVKSDEKRERNLSPTVEQYIDVYIEKYCKGIDFINGKADSPYKKSWKAEKRFLGKDVVLTIGHIKMVDVTRKDIMVVVNDVVDRGSGVTANRLLSCLKGMFNYAVTRGVIDESPCATIRKQVKEKPRKRILNDDEIKELWSVLDTAKGDYTQNKNNLFKMLLLSGQRLSEVRLMQWDDVQGNKWLIPEENTKNGEPHTVPVSPMMAEVLEWQNGFTGDQKYVFSGKRQSRDHQFGETCFERTGLSHAFKAIVDKFEWEKGATTHDLRRTLRSGLSGLKVLPIVGEKILNHKLPGLIDTYDHYDYFNDMHVALTKWGTHVEGIVYPERKQSNIIDFPQENTA